MDGKSGVIALAVLLAGCGVEGDPVANAGPTLAGGVAVGSNGVQPGVNVSDGVGRVSMGPGGVRVGAAGIPIRIGL